MATDTLTADPPECVADPAPGRGPRWLPGDDAFERALDLWGRYPRPLKYCRLCHEQAEPYRGELCFKCACTADSRAGRA